MDGEDDPGGAEGVGTCHRRAAGAGPGGLREGGVQAVFFQDDLSPSDDEGDSAGADLSGDEDYPKGAVSQMRGKLGAKSISRNSFLETLELSMCLLYRRCSSFMPRAGSGEKLIGLEQ